MNRPEPIDVIEHSLLWSTPYGVHHRALTVLEDLKRHGYEIRKIEPAPYNPPPPHPNQGRTLGRSRQYIDPRGRVQWTGPVQRRTTQ